MLPFNYSKLRGKIREVCGTQASFSVAMKCSQTTISGKLNNNVDFSQGEIFRAADILHIDKKEIPMYFFCEDSLEKLNTMADNRKE